MHDELFVLTPEQDPLWRAMARMDGALASLSEPTLRSQAHASETRTFRIEARVPAVADPVHWLMHQRPVPRVYFSDQNKAICTAGVGAADTVRARPGEEEGALWQRLTLHAPRARFYGGVRFDQLADTGEEWAPFGGATFVLPQCELQA